MKNISILGSTGSIGRQTLDVISMFRNNFRVIGLAAGKNIALLKEQILKFKPEIVSVQDEKSINQLEKELPRGTVKFLASDHGAEVIACHPLVDLVVSAMVGASGLKPTLAAIRSGKNIALANKEVLVMAGGIITKEAKKSGINIIPVDSEHSAIFQVLNQSRKDYVKRIILTASGGPLHKTPEDKLRDITPEVALNHPTWKMGRKISIDSATLMNKGFEVIEAKWLFGIKPESIAVWIHPQSIVHSMVEYIDGSIIAQMSSPNMKIPIAYALSYPERIQLDSNEISPIGFKELTFEDVNFDKFPALRVAYSAIEMGGTMPAVMSAANEEAVEAFLMGRIKFIDILRVVKKVMDCHKPIPGNSLEEIIQSDRWARDMSSKVISNIGEILQ